MVRLLVVNPNTSEAVTRAYLEAARRVAPEGVSLTGATGRFGARIVSNEAENLVAGHSALDLVADRAKGHDAVILAISFDTGLAALRSILPMPVVGITGAALNAACAGGRRIGVVIFGSVSRRLYETVLAGYGIEPVGIAAIEIGSAADYLSPGAQDGAVVDACARLERDGAEAVVLFGTAIVGMAARLAPSLGLPVYDGIEAVAASLSAIETQDRALDVRPRPLGESVGLSPALTRMLRGETR